MDEAQALSLIGPHRERPAHNEGIIDIARSSGDVPFIRSVVQKYGEAILVFESRKAPSPQRAASIESHAAKRVRERLTDNASLSNSFGG